MYKRKIEGERRVGAIKGKHENEVWYNGEEGNYKMYVRELQTYWSSFVHLNTSFKIGYVIIVCRYELSFRIDISFTITLTFIDLYRSCSHLIRNKGVIVWFHIKPFSTARSASASIACLH